MVDYPPEIISLPSKGWFYPKNHPFSNGTVLLNQLTGYHEDILTNINLIKKGITENLILKDLIIDKTINIDDILAVDKRGILLASKILAYGSILPLKITCPSCDTQSDINVNLLNFTSNDIHESFKIETNRFYYQIPNTETIIEYKFLTVKEEKSMGEYSFLKYLKTITTSISGNIDKNYINDFYDTEFLAKDSRNFRKYLKFNTPDIENIFTFTCPKCETTNKLTIPIDLSIFGISPNDKSLIHEEIFLLAYYSEGSFNQQIVYELPVCLRKYYIKVLKEQKTKETESIPDDVKKETSKIDKPNINNLSTKYPQPPKRRR